MSKNWKFIIIGAILVISLSILLFLLKQQQDIRQRAEELTPTEQPIQEAPTSAPQEEAPAPTNPPAPEVTTEPSPVTEALPTQELALVAATPTVAVQISPSEAPIPSVQPTIAPTTATSNTVGRGQSSPIASPTPILLSSNVTVKPTAVPTVTLNVGGQTPLKTPTPTPITQLPAAGLATNIILFTIIGSILAGLGFFFIIFLG